MSRIKFVCLLAVVACLFQTSSVFAVAGIGIHYGFDMTLKMDNKVMEQTTFDNLKMNLLGITGALPSVYDPNTKISGAQLPIFINRTDWKNTGINFGGKLYIDVIPFIDAFEVSTNFGVWQYDGAIIYPKSIDFNTAQTPGDPLQGWAHVDYDTMRINFKTLDASNSFWGVDKTPYAKLHVDATIRKYVLQIPPLVKMLKIYGGAGVSVDFATPMLSAHLIEDALGSTFNTEVNYVELNTKLSDPAVMKKVLDEIINKMMTPHFGCNIDVGAMIKIPVIPVGVYVDGKYIILFDKLDKYVDVGGNGLLINFGVALAF
jgi:hypothetical protein